MVIGSGRVEIAPAACAVLSVQPRSPHSASLIVWSARAMRRERLPRDHGHLAMMDASMTYLRQFAPPPATA